MKSRTNWKQWMRWWRRPSAAVRAQDFGDFGTAFGLELSLASSAAAAIEPAAAAAEAAKAANPPSHAARR